MPLDKIAAVTDAERSSDHASARLRWCEALFRHAGEAVYVANRDNRIVAVNPAFSTITGYPDDEVIGADPEFLRSDQHDNSAVGKMGNSLATTGEWQGEVWNRRKDGEVFLDWMTVVSLEDDAGEIEWYVAILSGVGRRRHWQSRFLHLANFDALTDLPSRQFLEGHLQDVIVAARSSEGEVAVICLDLENLKAVNDDFGHEVGDRVLATAAQTLGNHVQMGQILARFSGDEFVLIAPVDEREADASAIARLLLEAFEEPQRIGDVGDGEEFHLTASAGIALFPHDGETPGVLIRNAHTAALHARRQGSQTYKFFAADLNRRAMERMGLESRLRRAVEADQLRLLYQPVVDLKSGRISGVEALLRWQDSDDRMMTPEQFVPLAEERGLIKGIGDWVLQEACEQARRWQQSELPDLQIAINLSPRQLAMGDFPGRVEEILAKEGLRPESVEFEITESALIRSIEDVDAKLRRLREIGVSLAVDDFGTGYASLSYLRRFAVDAIKVDASFVADIGKEGDGEKLVTAVIAIGQSLGLDVVAEGVETAEQLDFLRRHWCERVQGFHVSRPLSADDLEALVRSGPRY